MQVIVRRSEKESNERFITRFNKKVQSSRKLLILRSTRYQMRPENSQRIRKRAMMRDYYRSLREKNKFY